MVTTGSGNTTVLGKTRHELGQSKVIVKISSTVFGITDIDNERQEFTANISVRGRWKEPLLAGILPQDAVNWNAQWTPRIDFENVVCIKNIVKKHEVKYFDLDERDGIPHGCFTMNVIATFKEFFELEDFPFDYQALNIWLKSEWPSDQVQLAKDADFKDCLITSTFPESNEWTLYPHLISEQVGEDQALELDRQTEVYQFYTMTCHVHRHSSYYMWNHICVMLMILLASFGSFALEPQSTAQRLNISILSVLVAVTFRNSVKDTLPRVAYWTTLSRYSLSLIVIHVTVVFENAIVGKMSQLASATVTYAVDYSLMALIFAATCICHISFAAQAGATVKRRKRFLNEEAASYSEDCKKTEERQHRWKQTSNDSERLLSSPSQTSASSGKLLLQQQQQQHGGDTQTRIPSSATQNGSTMRRLVEELTAIEDAGVCNATAKASNTHWSSRAADTTLYQSIDESSNQQTSSNGGGTTYMVQFSANSLLPTRSRQGSRRRSRSHTSNRVGSSDTESRV